MMKCCLNCNCEFHKGEVCPDCKGTNIVLERAEKEMYFKSVGRYFKCKACGFTGCSDEKILSCPICHNNANVIKMFK